MTSFSGLPTSLTGQVEEGAEAPCAILNPGATIPNCAQLPLPPGTHMFICQVQLTGNGSFVGCDDLAKVSRAESTGLRPPKLLAMWTNLKAKVFIVEDNYFSGVDVILPLFSMMLFKASY